MLGVGAAAAMQARQPAQRRAQGCPPPALLPPPAQGGRGLRPAGACLGRPGLLPGTARLRLVAEASYSAGSTGEGWRGDPPPSPPPPKQRPSAQELALQAASVQQDLARILTDAQREEQLRRERRLERARLRRPGQLKLGNPLSSISVDQRDMDAAIAHTFPVTGDAAPSAFPTGGGPRPPRSDSQDAPARDRRRLWPLPLPRRPISTVLVVSAALLNQKNEVLLSKRGRGNKNFRGLYEFPGGKIEPGEVPQFALQRELHEELGIEVDEGALQALTFVSHRYSIWYHNFLALLFVAEQWRYAPRSMEGQELVWVSCDDLMSYADKVPEPTKRMLAAVYGVMLHRQRRQEAEAAAHPAQQQAGGRKRQGRGQQRGADGGAAGTVPAQPEQKKKKQAQPQKQKQKQPLQQEVQLTQQAEGVTAVSQAASVARLVAASYAVEQQQEVVAGTDGLTYTQRRRRQLRERRRQQHTAELPAQQPAGSQQQVQPVAAASAAALVAQPAAAGAAQPAAGAAQPGAAQPAANGRTAMQPEIHVGQQQESASDAPALTSRQRHLLRRRELWRERRRVQREAGRPAPGDGGSQVAVLEQQLQLQQENGAEQKRQQGEQKQWRARRDLASAALEPAGGGAAVAQQQAQRPTTLPAMVAAGAPVGAASEPAVHGEAGDQLGSRAVSPSRQRYLARQREKRRERRRQLRATKADEKGQQQEQQQGASEQQSNGGNPDSAVAQEQQAAARLDGSDGDGGGSGGGGGGSRSVRQVQRRKQPRAEASAAGQPVPEAGVGAAAVPASTPAAGAARQKRASAAAAVAPAAPASAAGPSAEPAAGGTPAGAPAAAAADEEKSQRRWWPWRRRKES